MRILPSTSAVQYSGMGLPSAGQRPQVVQSEQVVGVVVRVQRGVDEAHVFADQLQPQFRRRVDEQVAPRRANEHGAAITVIVRIGRLTDGAVAADHGHPNRGAGAEEGKRTRFRHHALMRASFSRGDPYPGTVRGEVHSSKSTGD